MSTPWSHPTSNQQSKWAAHLTGEESKKTFPTAIGQTVVGKAKVATKSYDISGNVVDSRGDRPVDVNALHGVTPDATIPLQTFYDHPEEKRLWNNVSDAVSSSGSTGTPVQENPEQTFVGK